MPATNKPATGKKTAPQPAGIPEQTLLSKPQDWVDKQDIMNYFHLSDRTLQNLRDRNEITWSNIGGKLYYHLPSFLALLERNKRG
jgi:hypothetical protein